MSDTEAEKIRKLVAEAREQGENAADVLKREHNQCYEALDDLFPQLCDAVERLTGAMLAINKRHEADINDAIVTGFYAVRRILEGSK